MVTVSQIEALNQRLEKARELANGAVLPVAGQDGSWVVRNGDGSAMYLVTVETCTCPDFQHRASKLDFPCKHILSVQLTQDKPKDNGNGKSKAEAKDNEAGERSSASPCRSCGKVHDGPAAAALCDLGY